MEKRRNAAIDALRGLDMFLLTGGAGILAGLLDLAWGGSMPASWAKQFRHANWGEGFTCWDMVMPLFLFIVGCAMPFAFAKYRERGGERWRGATAWRVARRVALLFLLGMLVQGNLASADPSRMSLFCNTLQAIAEGYLVASLFLLFGGVRSQAAGCVACLALYWAALRFVPYDGRPGGLFKPDDNLAYYIDCLLQGHWQDGTSYTWILTSLAFGGLTLLGALGGQALRALPGWRAVAALAAAGVACLLGGLALERDTPMIKHLFTTSMTLWSGGWCLLLLALFHALFDLTSRFRALLFPLQVVGCNAILAYLLAQCPGVGGRSLWWGVAHPLLGGVAELAPAAYAPLVFDALSYGLFWLALLFLYRHKAFLRV